MPAQSDGDRSGSMKDQALRVENALAQADAFCADAGFRMTPVRRKVLEILLQSNRAVGAYAILDVLRAEGFGSQPPVVYRALEFLVAHGFVHKIERMNAFVACDHPGESHTPAFLICRVCDLVEEAHSSPPKTGLNRVARATGFQIERTVLEAEGVCTACSDETRK